VYYDPSGWRVHSSQNAQKGKEHQMKKTRSQAIAEFLCELKSRQARRRLLSKQNPVEIAAARKERRSIPIIPQNQPKPN
jgi:hypothetical protein